MLLNSEDDHAAALDQLGAIVKRSKSGRILSLDLRPVADKITDDELPPLASFASLRDLYLAGAPITDQGLQPLRCLPKLNTLDLQHTGITDEGLDVLKQLRSLKLLLLNGSHVTRDAVKAARKSMLHTRIVFLG